MNNLGVRIAKVSRGTLERRIDTVGQIDYDADKLKAELNRRLQLPGLANVWVIPIKIRIDMLATGIKTPVGIKFVGPDLGERIDPEGRGPTEA